MRKVIISIFILLVVLVSIVLGKLLITPNNTGSEAFLSNEINRYKSYKEVTDEDAKIKDCEFVTFNAFFTRDLDGDGYAEKYNGTCNRLDKTANLYFDINVLTDGQLKDGKIKINGKNFILSTTLVKDEVLEQDYIGKNITEFDLKDLNNGTQKLFSGKISANIGNNIGNYSVEDNTVTLTGTWVSSESGEKKDINKTINLTVDWHGITSTAVYNSSSITTSHNIDGVIGTDDITLSFNVGYRETAEELLIQKQVTEVTIPLLNGYEPDSVIVTTQNCSSEYNDETGKLTITRQASLADDEKTIVGSVSRSNIYSIQVKYPLEAYEGIEENESISLVVPTVGYYYGYNNTSKEFENVNPYVSSASKTYTHIWREIPVAGPTEPARPVTYSPSFNVYVGKYSYNIDTKSYQYVISKKLPLKIYNKIGQDEEEVDEYVVEWKAFTGNTTENQNGIYLQENGEDKFYESENNSTSMKEYINTRAIYFSSLDGLLEENGWVKLYDGENGNLIKTFTKSDWNKYNSSSPYELPTPVKSIKVETSVANENSYLYVYQIKTIDDELLTDKIKYEDFEKFNYIYSYLTGGLFTDRNAEEKVPDSELEENIPNTDIEEGENVQQRTKTKTDKNNKAYYEAPVSTATFFINPNIISNQETKRVVMEITTQANYFNEEKWKNGEFLIELPKDILAVDIESIKSNNEQVKVSSYETYEENGKQYIKVFTSNEKEDIYKLTINADLTADPREPTKTDTVKLYAINEECPNYRTSVRTADELDMNGNSNKDEYVFTKSVSLQIIAPSSLLTSQTLSNFDDKESEVVSPQIAILDKSSDDRTAKINITITNNYSGTISEPLIIGKIPFKGNTYQINGSSLNSTYSVTMKDSGITLPDGLKDIATVYYSDKEKVTNNLADEDNNWKKKEDVSDWKNIKNYAIDLQKRTLQKNDKFTFSYEIEVPKDIKYNEVAYSTHAVYFCLDTEDGKLKTQTEVNRLGIMIAKKYDINLTKFKKVTERKVQGAAYKVTDGDLTRTGITDENGNITISGLYVDKVYTLSEIQSPSNYILTEGDVKFKVTIDEGTGKPEVCIIKEGSEGKEEITEDKGILKSNPDISNTDDGKVVVKLEVEDVAKFDVKIVKKDKSDQTLIKGVKFKVTGGAFGETGRIFTTDENGELNITNLIPGTTYNVKETKATGYYLMQDEVSFSVSRDSDNKLKVDSKDTNFKNATIKESKDVDKAVVEVNIQNEPIPTYSLKIVKKNKDEETLSGTQFKLTSEDTGEISYATTDDEGNLTFEGLYEFVENKYITGKYVLQEVLATEGYITDNTEVKFKVTKKDEALEIDISDGSEVVKSQTVSENTIILEFENEPIFNLTKYGDNEKLLPGAKFKVVDIDGNYVNDVNGNPIGELIGRFTSNKY